MANKMAFKTPCLVCVEDAKKRKKLFEWACEIGYVAAYRINEYYPVLSTALTQDCIDICPKSIIENLVDYGAIDCGTDIELFKALAAMNDENDREQWFIITADVYCDLPPGHMFKCQPHPSQWHVGASIDPMYCRKATTEEIEHFNTTHL